MPFNRLNSQVLTPELMWKINRLGSLKSSPDGKSYIYSVSVTDMPNNKSLTNLFLVDVESGKQTQIGSPEDKISSPRFRPDGKMIGYLSSKSGKNQIWEMNLDGSNKHQLSTFKEDISGFTYSNTNKYIAYIQDVNLDIKDKDLYKDLDKTTGKVFDGLNFRHWDTWSDGSYQHVFYTNYSSTLVTDGKDILLGTDKFDAPVKPFGGEEQVIFSKDDSKIIYNSKKLTGTEYANSTNSDLYAFDIATNTTKDLTSTNLGYDNDPVLSPDGGKMIYSSMQTPAYESDKNRLLLYDFTTAQIKDITEKFEHGVDMASWSFSGKKIYFITTIHATKQLFEYDVKSDKIIQLTQGDHDYNTFALINKNKSELIIGARVNFNSPTEFFEVDPKLKTQIQITNINKDILGSVKFGKVEKRMVKAKDGKDILTWVCYPPNFDATKKYPVLLYCQGGPQSPVSQFWSTRWNFALMAAKGYIVVAPNRRGLPSFGKEWNDAIIGDYGGMPMQDYLSAIDDVAKEPYADKDKMGAVGASYGGYSVYWLAGNHNKRFKALIAHCGMFNMVSWYGSTEEMFFANHDQNGPYWSNSLNYQKNSPHKFVNNWDAPILVIHNEKDFRVPLTQGLEAFTAAQERGIPSRFLYFPDENHWVSKPQNGVLWQRVFFNWLDKYLK